MSASVTGDAAGVLVDPAIVRPGTVVGGRYRILQQLGTGGFGTVFKAADERMHDQSVAVKMLNVVSDAAREELREEIRQLSSVNDPYVLRTTDWGLHGDSLFMVTEFVEGETLTSMMTKRREAFEAAGGQGHFRFEPVFAANVGFWVARSLIAVHAQRIVHRDLTPNNVMVKLNGEGNAATIHSVKLIDFGLASARGAVFQEARGTANYVAPEVLRGQPLGPNTDVYSLGCVLYEMVMGVAPYDHPDYTWTCDRHRSDEPPPVMDSGLSDFDELVARMMAKSADRRADSTKRLTEELNRVVFQFEAQLTRPRARLPTMGPTPTSPLPVEPVAPATIKLPRVPEAALPAKPGESERLAAEVTKGRRRPLLVVGALALMGLGVLGVRWLGGSTPPEDAPEQPVAVAPPVPPLKPVEPALMEPAVAAVDAGEEDELSPVSPRPVKLEPRCTPSPAWRERLEADLKELGQRSNSSSEKADRYDQAEPALSRLILEAKTDAECRKTERDLGALKKFILGTK